MSERQESLVDRVAWALRLAARGWARDLDDQQLTDARREINGFTTTNCAFYSWDARHLLQKMIEEEERDRERAARSARTQEASNAE